MERTKKIPLFIMGPPRSGTTILTQVLNTSEKILITDEMRSIAWLLSEVRKIRGGHERNGDPYPFINGKRLAKYIMANGSHFLLSFYEKLSKEEEKDNFIYWGDKYPHFDNHLQNLPAMFPKAKYIIIFRNILEVINSVSVGHKWDVKKSTKYCLNIFNNYLDGINSLDREKIFVFDYAHLNSEKNIYEIEKIFNFLQINIDEKHKNLIQTSLSYQSHSVRSRDKIGKKFAIQKSKHILTDDEIFEIKKNPKVKIIQERLLKLFNINVLN